jgi:hypothetical protein
MHELHPCGCALNDALHPWVIQKGDAQLYVNRGISTITFPIQAQNQGLLGIAEILVCRTQIRINTEVWCKWRGRLALSQGPSESGACGEERGALPGSSEPTANSQ